MAPASLNLTTLSGRASARLLFRLLSIVLVAGSAYGAADECASVADECQKDADCLACLAADAAPVACATTATTCADWWTMACCTYGNSETCLENEPLIRHLQCLVEGNDCIIDGVCPDGSADRAFIDVPITSSGGDNTVCTPELTACTQDSGCLGCLSAVTDGCAADTATTVCGAVSELMCCMYGTSDACLGNTALAAFTECVAGQSGCTMDGLCSDGQESAEAVGTVDGTVDGTEDGDNDLDVDPARASGGTVTCAAAVAWVLPVFLLGVAVFL